ncbi:Detected protein of confused Function [Hibiscus syriacus]|uniref:Ubiquitin thioesterase OTU n=1 Tax=Hibiscus syriacus TaxID=106335 RepID=A0A6A2Z4H7_HIBSY|nr:Detected protein of confused Function [Hibiscus syriacus]
MSSDPKKYSKAFLGKPNAEYCAWILDSDKWGGAIELSILADYYGCEIAAYDIQTTCCDLYGQEIDIGSLDIGDFLAIGAMFAATDSVHTLQVISQDETLLLYNMDFGECCK